jgi:HEAT repeat protein
MQIAVSKIAKLTSEKEPSDVRCSAITVLGELGGRDGEVNSAIIEALNDEDPEVRIRAIRAAGRLGIERALPGIAERLKAGGPEAEAAAEAAAGMSAKGTTMLRDLMPRVAPGLRRYIAAALSRVGVYEDASELDVLTDKDPAVVDAAVTAVTAAMPSLDDRQRKRLADTLIKLGTSRKAKLAPASEAGVLRLAGLLEDARIAPLLWDKVLPPNPSEVRANALQALGKWVTSPGKDERDKLFKCAADADFRVAAPALMILDRLPASEKLTPGWVKLLRAPDIAARRVAMKKVGDRGEREIVDALLEQVRHPDLGYRRDVFDYLGKSDRGRKALGKMLKEAESTDEAWNLAKALVPFASANPDQWMDELFPVASGYIEAGDQRANPVLFVLRESSTSGLRERLEKRAAALVKRKDYEPANFIYRVLARDPAIGFPIRLAIAACGLKVSPKELEEMVRAQDPALHQFGELAAQDQATVLKYLAKTPWLDAEDHYYLGFHFAESTGALREFGAEVLRLLLKRFSRSKLANAAKNKLKSIK